MVQVIVIESLSQKAIDCATKSLDTAGEQPPVILLLIRSVCACTQAAISASRAACAAIGSALSNSQASALSSAGLV